MEAGWVQDSFEKNDMFIDRAFSTYIDHIHEKDIPEKDCREIQLDLYRKDGEGEKTYRMIVALSDETKKIIKIGDALVKVKGMDFTIESTDYGELKQVTIPNDKTAAFTEKYGNGAILNKFEFKKPIKEKFFLVKAGGNSHLCKLNAEKNSFEEYFKYSF